MNPPYLRFLPQKRKEKKILTQGTPLCPSPKHNTFRPQRLRYPFSILATHHASHLPNPKFSFLPHTLTT